MSSSLATSGIVEPEASLPSACRSFRMICSGECLFPIRESPPFAHRGLLDSHPNWTRFRGSGQQVARPHLLYAIALCELAENGIYPVAKPTEQSALFRRRVSLLGGIRGQKLNTHTR